MPNTMTPSAFLMEKVGDKKVKDMYIKKSDNMLIILKC